MLGIGSSSYYEYCQRNSEIDVTRTRLRIKVNELFNLSRGSAGSRTITSLMQEAGYCIGRFKVTRLMKELGLVSKQPGSHAYKSATIERPDIPNQLNRELPYLLRILSGVAILLTSGQEVVGIT